MATTKTIQSVERAFSILEYLQQCGGGERSVKEIADALELNKSTAFGLINTLTTLGYLQQNADNQKYVLSLKLLSFSNTIKVQNSIIRTVHPYLEQISLKYGEIAHCGVAQGDSVIYVDKVESSRSLSINTQIGTKNYLHCTGFLCLLRMFLSFRLLSPTTEKKRFCQTYAKEKRCNLKKDYNAF